MITISSHLSCKLTSSTAVPPWTSRWISTPFHARPGSATGSLPQHTLTITIK